MGDVDELEMALRMHQVQLERADRHAAALRRIRSVAATAGTNGNAWNEVVDLIDATIGTR